MNENEGRTTKQARSELIALWEWSSGRQDNDVTGFTAPQTNRKIALKCDKNFVYAVTLILFNKINHMSHFSSIRLITTFINNCARMINAMECLYI